MPQDRSPDLLEELADHDVDAQTPAGAAPWWMTVADAGGYCTVSAEAAAYNPYR